MALWALQLLQGLHSVAGMEGGRGKPVVEGGGKPEEAAPTAAA